ncbi:hypothetical protein [Phenylobacterium sp.]|uniref:hypothetical protein n=1 Tax=Phenylobacterium sp. TaxID=1871053 RepID=UPI0025D241C3|nr:hypothetical protein [Phenylobacterium sp.]MBX3484960.1 hypothetical protein [Phenylobacterium sp.]
MDLLERYLAAIARHLPEAQKADVAAELRDVLLSQIEEAEDRLGRPQTREELEALLIRFGHPLTVSGRYRKTQHLIGPEVFPFWWAAVKAVCGVILGVWVVMTLVVIIAGDHMVVDRVAGDTSLFGFLVFGFGAVTLVCALIERFGKTTFLQQWKPSQLPPPERKTKSRFERVVEIGMGVVFILWWMGLIRFRNFMPDYGMTVAMAPVWREMYGPILGYALFELAMNLIALFQPGLVAFNRAMSLVRNLMGAAVIGAVYQAGHWIEVSWSVWTPDVAERVQANFDTGMRIGVGATIVIFLALAAVDVWRLWQMHQARRGTGAPKAA